jgi:hypothetical protein
LFILLRHEMDVLIVFDTNVLTDDSVNAARRELAAEIRRRKGKVRWVDLPAIQGVNGVDDLLAKCGPDFVAGLFAQAVNTALDTWETPSPFNTYNLPAFPLDALYPWLSRFVQELATSPQSPADMAAMLVLANIAAAFAGRIVARVYGNWSESVNLYILIALGVGNRKTAVHDACKDPLEEIENQMIERMEPIIDEMKVEKQILELRLEILRKDAAKADTPDERRQKIEEAKELSKEINEIKIPASPVLIASGDITPEAIASTLAEQDGRLFISSDEGEIFELVGGRYGNKANFEVLLKAHTGGKVRATRRTRKEVVEDATLTIGMTVQPDVLRGTAETGAFRGRGLMGRFLYSIPISLVGHRNSR